MHKYFKISKNKNEKLILNIFFLITAILFLLLFSSTTSPFCSEPFAGDSAMFQTIGKYWTKGYLPYVDLWDSKGPVIFGINALGYLITGNKNGIFIIQILCLFISIKFLYKFYIISFKTKQAVGLVLLTLVLLLPQYDANSTEEFLLPLLCICFYMLFKWTKQIKKQKYEHNKYFAFMYGITFSFCLLTRLINAVGLCMAILIIAVFLIIKKQWKNLFENILMFLLGAFLLLLPFVIYFLSKGILSDALYGTILYNLTYASNSDILISIKTQLTLNKILLAYSPSVLLTLTGLIRVIRLNNKFVGILWGMVGLVTSLWLFNSNGYLHYGLIAIPYLPVIVIEIKSIAAISSKTTQRVFKPLCIIFISLCVLSSLQSAYLYTDTTNQFQTSTNIQQMMIKTIPDDEKDSFIAYNTNTGIYLQSNLLPCYSIFTFQDWAVSRNPSMKSTLLNMYQTKKAKWLLLEGNPNTVLIKDILQSDYKCVSAEISPSINVSYYLYTLKE